MVIGSVEVKRFRSIRDTRLDCDALTVLVGRNGAGKSSFLHGLRLFYDIAAPVTEEDFFARDTSAPIEIRVTYGGLRDVEKSEFRPYLHGETLTVTKRIWIENGRVEQRYYAASPQIREFAEIRRLPGKRERLSAWRELVESGTLPQLSGAARSADDVERFMSEYETLHPELLVAIEREEQFFGPRNVGGGKLDKYTKYVLVPAVRDASEETGGRKGAVYQLIDMIVLRKVNMREDVQQLKADFEQRVKRVYSSENLTELPELGDSISATLARFAPGSRLNLKWGEVTPPEVQLPAPRTTLVEDDFEGDVDRKGHGLQRALILSLLQHLAVLTGLERPSVGGGNETAATLGKTGTEASRGPDLILAIEEPELYLHPSRCRYLAGLLLKLASQSSTSPDPSNQIIYTTHSPYFVDLDRFDQIRMVRKSAGAASVPETVTNSYSKEDVIGELARIGETDPLSFSTAGFVAHSRPVMTTVVSEGFFADVVVVVEGWSDVGVLWTIQGILGKDWAQLGISVVPAGSKTSLDRPVIVFRGFGIPTYFVFDTDSTEDKDKVGALKHAKYCLRLAGSDQAGFPGTQVHGTWAALDPDLECVIESAVGTAAYRECRAQATVELGYSRPEKAIKNIEVACRMVALLYERGHRVQQLEELVEKVTSLHPSHAREQPGNHGAPRVGT